MKLMNALTGSFHTRMAMPPYAVYSSPYIAAPAMSMHPGQSNIFAQVSRPPNVSSPPRATDVYSLFSGPIPRPPPTVKNSTSAETPTQKITLLEKLDRRNVDATRADDENDKDFAIGWIKRVKLPYLGSDKRNPHEANQAAPAEDPDCANVNPKKRDFDLNETPDTENVERSKHGMGNMKPANTQASVHKKRRHDDVSMEEKVLNVEKKQVNVDLRLTLGGDEAAGEI